MAKESSAGSECPGCGRHIYYVEQHIPNCPNYPTNIAAQVHKANQLAAQGK